MRQSAHHLPKRWELTVRWHMPTWLSLLLAVHFWTQCSHAQVLNPPYFNIAEGRKVGFASKAFKILFMINQLIS